MISSVTSTGATSSPEAELTRAWPPSASPRRSASSGWTCTRAAVLALDQRGQVVHPGVVRAQLAAADQHHVAVDVAVGAPSAQLGLEPRHVGEDLRRRQLDLARRRSQHLGQPRAHRAQVDPVRAGLQLRQRQAVGVGAEALAERPHPDHEVDDPLGAAAVGERRERSRRRSRPSIGEPGSATSRPISVWITSSSQASMSASGPWPAAIAARRRMHLPLVRLAVGRLDHRRRPVGDAADASW